MNFPNVNSITRNRAVPMVVIGSEGLRNNRAVFVDNLILIVAAMTFSPGVAYVGVWARKAYMFENGRAIGEEAD